MWLPEWNFVSWVIANNISIKVCDCDGPYYGIDHADDCAYILNLEELQARYEQEMWDYNNTSR